MGVDKIIALVGVIVAIVAGVMGGFPQSELVIAVLGLVGGWFIKDEDRPRFYMATVALIAVQGALASIPAVGGYVTGALGGLAALFSAACVTAIVMATVDRVKP